MWWMATIMSIFDNLLSLDSRIHGYVDIDVDTVRRVRSLFASSLRFRLRRCSLKLRCRSNCANISIAWRRETRRTKRASFITTATYNVADQRSFVRHLIPFDYVHRQVIGRRADRSQRNRATTYGDDESRRLSQSSTPVGARSSETNDDKQPARSSIPSSRGGFAQFVRPGSSLPTPDGVALTRWRRKSTRTTDGGCRVGRQWMSRQVASSAPSRLGRRRHWLPSSNCTTSVPLRSSPN